LNPSYSVVIASIRLDPAIRSLSSLSELPRHERPAEVIVAVGRNPSHQRNLGVAAARHPLVYFLDDDSHVPPGTPSHLVSHFTDERVAVAGGPNLASSDATPFERTVSAVLASWMGSFSVRTRYSARGSVKEATEKDLILCNMMVRKDIFLSEGGFRKDLFPNEENEFLNRLLHLGHQLIYDPTAHVVRPRRKNWWAWTYQAFRYGQGRARQMRVYPCLSDLVHTIPAFFLLYLVGAVVLAGPCPIAHPVCPLMASPILHTAFTLPLTLYLLLIIGTGLSAASWHRRLGDLWNVPLLILARHLGYGAGWWAGLLGPFSNLRRDKVELFTAKPSRKGWSLQSIPPKRSRP